VPSETSRAGRIAVRLVPFLAALTTFLAFMPALRCGFVGWDDPMNFLQNEHYRGLGWANLHWMFTTFHMGNYQPLSWLTLGADYKLWGMDAHGYHLTNVLIHAANAALLCTLCTRLLSWPPQRSQRPLLGGAGCEAPDGRLAGKDGWSLAVAALFGALFWSLHPLRVESVAWVTERRDVLSTAFYLATVLCYLRWTSSGGRRWWWAALAAYVLSLLSKAMGMTLPFALLILDIYPLRRRHADLRARLLEKLPFLALAAAAGGAALMGQRQVQATLTLAQFGVFERLVRSSYGLVFYLRKAVFPFALSPYYEMRTPFNPFEPRLCLCLPAACVLAWLVWRLARRLPGLAAAMAFYVVSASPVIGVFPIGNYLAADRYSYLPLMGFSILGAGLLRRVLYAWRGQLRVAALAAAGVATLAGGALAWRQCRFWRDTEALWGRALALDPTSATAHQNLGAALSSRGDRVRAVLHYRAALTVRPRWTLAERALRDTLYDEGNERLRQGRWDEAAQFFYEALALDPGFAESHNNLGLALAGAGRGRQACREYAEALRLKPGFAAALYNWGNSLADMGELPSAAARYQEAIVLDSGFWDARFNLGNTLARLGRYRQSAVQYAAIPASAPCYSDAQRRLDAVHRLAR